MLAKKLGVTHIQDINKDGIIDMSDVKGTKALMDAKAKVAVESK